MKIIPAILLLVAGFYFLGAIGEIFISVVGFLIDNLTMPLLGLAVILFLFGKKS